MAIETHSDLAAEASRVAQAALSAGVETNVYRGVRGWLITDGKLHHVQRGTKWQDGTDWMDYYSHEDKILLGTDGQLHVATHRYGSTEDIRRIDEWYVEPASRQFLVGNSGEPFAAVASALRRFKAIAS